LTCAKFKSASNCGVCVTEGLSRDVSAMVIALTFDQQMKMDGEVARAVACFAFAFVRPQLPTGRRAARDPP
jgi:hypothetical protein